MLARGCLWHKGKLVLPAKSSRIPLILEEFHSIVWGGHSGVLRTFKRVTNVFYWKGMRRDIAEFVQKCEICQNKKYQALKPTGLLQSIPVPDLIWEELTINFIGGLPMSKCKDTTNYLRKHIFFPCHLYSAKDVAQIFITEVVRLHGFPNSIISDRDHLFMSTF